MKTSPLACRDLVHTKGSWRTRGEREEERETCYEQSVQDHGRTVGDRRCQQGEGLRSGAGGGTRLRGVRVHRRHQERR